MNPLTHSEMATWQKCRRGWYVTYYLRLRRWHDFAPLPNIGTMYHDGLEAYYNGTLTDPAAHVRDLAEKKVDELPEYAETIYKNAEMAAIMLEGYMEWLEETGADAGLTIIGSEQEVQAKLGQTEFVLRGKIDARLQRESDGAKLQLEPGTELTVLDYARSILKELRAQYVRAEIDESTDKINGKVQRAEQMKVHTMLVIGKRDMEANAVSVRVHGKGNLGAKPRNEVIADILASIKERRA